LDIFVEHVAELLAMGLLLLCSAFFSGTESALFSLRKEQIRKLRHDGVHVERMLHLFASNPSGLLVAILFGNLVVNILFFCMSTVLGMSMAARFGDWGTAATGVVVLLLVILMGEILPKAVGISFPERVVRLNSLPLSAWFHAMRPVRQLLERVVARMDSGEDHNRLGAEELKMLIDATHHDLTFGKQEKAIVEDIVNLPEIRVRELMVPRVEQFFRPVETPAEEALIAAAEREIELIPVYDGEEDNIVGVVEVKELFVNNDPQAPLSRFSHPVRFVPETKRADQMLREFLAEKLQMVCVVNEYGGLAGTIVLEDLLEEVVGEFDVLDEPGVEQLGEATYRLQGSLGIREWRTLFVGLVPREMMQGLALDTLSGLVLSLLRRMPRTGDTVTVGNLKFTVEKIRANRIESVLLELENRDDGGRSR
jgi:CBS domain containing-hemolysin-like protein